MMSAAIVPGTQPHNHNKKTINIDPQPLPITAKGGQKMANITLQKLIFFLIIYFINVIIRRLNNDFVTT
tara:strand:- start:7013 stop:7219 length:207 start_codon:yes stop_codon:yes gene_type:complete